jgi:hypothetical protein
MAGMMIARNIKLLQDGIASARSAWAALEGRGLALGVETVSGLAASTGAERPTLTGTIGGNRVAVRIHSDVVHYAHTEVLATGANGADAVVGVHVNPGGVMGYLRGWLGQDIEVGDETFDPAYFITGKPEEAAKSLLVPSLRELIVAIGPKLGGFTYSKGAATVVLHGVETDVAILGAAVDLAAAAAAFKP